MKDNMRIMPHSSDDELSLLSLCLYDPEELINVTSEVTEDCFYSQANKDIFNALKESVKTSGDLNYALIKKRLQDNKILDSVIKFPVTITPEYTTSLLKDLSLKRRLIKTYNQKMNEIYEGSTTGKNSADETIQELMSFEIKDKNAPSHISEIIPKIKEDIKKIKAGDSPYQGIMTGFKSIDSVINGLQNQDFIIIAARPSMGKTALAMNIAANVTGKENVPVLVFSLEMSKDQLVLRMACSEGRVNSTRLKGGFLSLDEVERLESTNEVVETYPIFIDDNGNQTLNDVTRKAHEFKKKHNIGLVIIDYLQLMKLPKADRNDLAIGEVSRGLKGLAKALNIPVIALSQLNRNLEQRTNKRPVMADLRESGALEQDADVIMFVYRDEVYNTDENNPNKGKAEIIISKNRNGPCSTAFLTWIGKYTRFENFAVRI